MTLPTLYKKTSTGAIQQWQIQHDGDQIITSWGQVGGEIQSTVENAQGKNVGKKNQTSPRDQAEKEAKARWTKQLKKGYVPSIEQAQAGEVDTETIKGGVAPMLAHVYEKHRDKVSYPCFVQPKLDGHRCIAVVKDGGATLWTRTRKPITSMPHIVKALETWWQETRTDVTLDGELYRPDMTFEELTGLIRTPTPSAESVRVEYCVFDKVSQDPQAERTLWLDRACTNSYVIRIRSKVVDSEEEMHTALADYLEEGHEGLMIRSLDGLYKHGRSYDLLKVKEFDSSEFVVVGVKGGKGKLAGHAVFTCRVQNYEDTYKGTEVLTSTFDVKLTGPQGALKKYWADPSLAVGRKLEVKHQGLTEAGMPRFPVGLRFRDDT